MLRFMTTIGGGYIVLIVVGLLGCSDSESVATQYARMSFCDAHPTHWKCAPVPPDTSTPGSDTTFAAVVRGIRPRGFGSGEYTLPLATYYVATEGSDANPGTSAAPFRTINRAAQVAVAGDVVTIRDGVYSESVVVANGGVTFQAEHRGSVVLTGRTYDLRAAGWTGGKIASQPHVTLRGLIFQRYGALTADATGGGGVRASHGWRIDDCLFDEAGLVGLHIRADSVVVTRSTFRAAYLHAIVAWAPATAPAIGLVFRDLLLVGNGTNTDPQDPATSSKVVKLLTTRDALVDNIESAGNYGHGWWFDASNAGYLVRNSYFHDNTASGLDLEISWGGIVEGNVFANNGRAGLYIQNTSDVTVRHNLFDGGPAGIELTDWLRTSGGLSWRLRNISITSNHFRNWSRAAIYHGISYYGVTPQELGVVANFNTYTSTGQLGHWLGTIATTIPQMQMLFGWETSR